MRRLFVGFAAFGLAGCAAQAQDTTNGDYLCTVAEKAGIASIHLEGASPPEAYVEEDLPTRFLIRIADSDNAAGAHSLVELPYGGPDLDQRDYGTPFSVIHETYYGDGVEFAALQAPSYFSLFETVHGNADGDLAFYHLGFEYPGGEDTELAVRWGRCRRE